MEAKLAPSSSQPRESFNVFSILQSPMILMSVFMMAGVYFLPKMMEGIDPEELKQAQEMMAGGKKTASAKPAAKPIASGGNEKAIKSR